MNPGRMLLTLAAIVGSLLVVIDVAIRYRTYAFTRQFKIANVRTNDSQALMILDGKTGKPLWGKWDWERLVPGSKPAMGRLISDAEGNWRVAQLDAFQFSGQLLICLFWMRANLILKQTQDGLVMDTASDK